MKFEHVIRAVAETPWAIRPDRLAAILELIALRMDGTRLTQEEIEARVGAAPARRQTVTSGSVAIIPLAGVLVPKAGLLTQVSGATSVEQFGQAFGAALNDPSIDGILLHIDSPGGMTDLVPEVAAQIRAARSVKPVTAVANTDAASAAYWLGSQAGELYVTPSGSVGSIGVFAAHEDVSGAQEQAGVRTTLISAGKFKVEGNPFEPLSEEARAAIQDRVDQFYGMFVQDVAKGRGVGVQAVRDGFGQGRLLTARDAMAAGMVDGIATFDEALRRLQRSSAQAARSVAVSAAASSAVSVAATAAGPISPHSTDVIDRPWDGPAAVAKLKSPVTGKTGKRVFAWFDSHGNDPDGDGFPDAKADWKFPHHEVSADGEPGPANVNGVRQAMARIKLALIPEGDRDGVRAHLQRHLDDWHDQSPPGANAGDESIEAAESGLSFADEASALRINADRLIQRATSLAEVERSHLTVAKREHLTACTEGLRESVEVLEGLLADTRPKRSDDVVREAARFERQRANLQKKARK